MSALTSNIVNRTYELKQGRTPAYRRVDIRVGNGQTIVGHPFLRNANYKPIDVLYQEARVSDTPRIGETMFLPDRRLTSVESQQGEGFKKTFKKIKKGIKKGARVTKKIAGVVKEGSKIVETGARLVGREDIAEKAKGVREQAKTVQKISKAIGGSRYGNPLVMRGGANLQQNIDIARGLAAGKSGSERLTFVAVSPLNFKRAKLQ